MLGGLFDAQRVAVVGVSTSPDNLGRVIVNNMVKLGYQGELYMVGRSGGELFGRPIWPTPADIPSSIDLAVLIVPIRFIAETLEQCGQKGARWAVVTTSGFSEYSDERRPLEDEIRAVLRRHSMRMVGPNGLGVLNMATGLATPFSPFDPKALHQGPISVIAQSGGVAQYLAEAISNDGAGLNKFVSVGNKLDLDEVDYLEYFAGDQSTEVITLFLEGFRRGEAFVEAAQRCTKPVLLFKGNVSDAGARVARSHTGAMAGDDLVVDAAMRRAGVVRVRNMRDLATVSGVLRLPRLAGNRLAVICSSGGFSVLLGDRCELRGFALPPIGASLLSEIESWGRAGVIKLTNPLDMGDFYDPRPFLAAVRKIVALPEIDGAIVVYPMGYRALLEVLSGGDQSGNVAFARELKAISLGADKPIVASSMGGRFGITEISRAADYPIVISPEDAVDAMAVLREHSALTARRGQAVTVAEYRGEDGRHGAAQLIAEAAANGQHELGMECLPALAAYGLPVVVPQLATSEEEAAELAAELGVPVAMKVRSPEVLHKSDAGGVRLGVEGAAAAAAYREIVASVRRRAPEANIVGVDVQPMIAEGWEVIVGARRDPQFGAVVMFGLGGIYAEALNESSLRLAPVGRDEALEMIAELRAGRLLSGLRGQQAADVPALAELIVSVSRLAVDVPEIGEIDLNPVKVLAAGQGCRIVDARVIVAR